jgi:hypothetical protein
MPLMVVLLVLGILLVTFLFDPANLHTSYIADPLFLAAGATANSKADGSSFDLAVTQSYGFFAAPAISNAAWRRLQQRTAQAPQYRFPNYPTRAFGVPTRWWIKNVQPLLTCPHMVRLGGDGSVAPEADGVFGLCAAPSRIVEKATSIQQDTNESYDCVVYAIGYSGGWEEDISSHYPSCEVHVLDPRHLETTAAVAAATAGLDNLYFHPWGVVSAYATSEGVPKSGAVYATLREIRHRLGHSDRTVDVLKVDCGTGCAWSLYRDWIDAAPTQLVVQLHGLPSPHGPNEFHTYGPLSVSTVLETLITTSHDGRGGYLLYDKVYRRAGARVVLGWLRAHGDFWKEVEAMRQTPTN